MKTKKIVSVLLSLVLGVAMFVPVQVSAEDSTTPEGMMYLDEFSEEELSSDWTVGKGTHTVSSGTLNSLTNTFSAYLEREDGASSWTDYSVEADVTFNAVNTKNSKATAGVALRSNSTGWYGGYIMKLEYVSTSSKLTIALYSGDGSANTQLGDPVTISTSEEIGQTYHLKLSVVGDELVGYVNGTNEITYIANAENLGADSATQNIAGYPGVMVNNGTVAIDNFVVTDSSVLYADVFGMKLTNDWTYQANAQINGTLNRSDGTYYAWLDKEDGVSTWKNYSVEADMTFSNVNDSNKATAGIATLAKESSWYGGYIMKLFYASGKVTVELHNGSDVKDTANTKIGNSVTLVSSGAAINKTYHLKLTVVGDKLLGYVDGEIVIEHSPATEHKAGYPGVMVNTGRAVFDNFVVTKIPENSIVIGEVANNATVYVDGKASPEAKTTGIVQAALGQSVQIITIDSEDSNKAATNEVYLVKTDGTVVRPECLQNAISYEGTAIRTTGNKGIRFKSTITKTAKAGGEEFTLKEYGTVVTKETILNGDDLYLGATYATVKGVAYEKDSKDMIFEETDTLVQFTGVLINIAESNYSTTYVARPYAIYEDTDGTQYKIYGNMVGRSLAEIAQLALADTEYGYTEAEKTYFQSIVDKVTGGQTE